MLARGIPANRQSPSGLIVAVRLCWYAAAPAGVKIAVKPPGMFWSIFRSSGPRQKPDRSGLPSEARGVARDVADVVCCAATPESVTRTATMHVINTATFASGSIPTQFMAVPRGEILRLLHGECGEHGLTGMGH